MQLWLQPGLFQRGIGSYCQFPEAGFLLKTLGGHPCSHGCLEGDLRRWIIGWFGGGWDCVLRWGYVSNPSPISIICSPGHRSFPKTRRPISTVKINLWSLRVSWLKGLSQHQFVQNLLSKPLRSCILGFDQWLHDWKGELGYMSDCVLVKI